jgi:hypothetical protein
MSMTDGKEKIDPILRAWLDRVLVPAMVRLYLDSSDEVRDNRCSLNPSEETDTPPSEQVQ